MEGTELPAVTLCMVYRKARSVPKSERRFGRKTNAMGPLNIEGSVCERKTATISGSTHPLKNGIAVGVFMGQQLTTTPNLMNKQISGELEEVLYPFLNIHFWTC